MGPLRIPSGISRCGIEEVWFVPFMTFALSTPDPQRAVGFVRGRAEVVGERTNGSFFGCFCTAASRCEICRLIVAIR